MSSFLWKNLKPDQSPDPCCSTPGFRSSRSACLRPACCRHFRSCRGLSVMEEQKQLCLCLQLHLHMRPLHLQPAAALTPPCKRSQTQADAELQLLNQKATMCLHIHEWKGQLETQTLSMCLRARCTHSTDFYSEKYNIFQKDSSDYVCCSWRHLRCAKPHENI